MIRKKQPNTRRLPEETTKTRDIAGHPCLRKSQRREPFIRIVLTRITIRNYDKSTFHCRHLFELFASKEIIFHVLKKCSIHARLMSGLTFILRTGFFMYIYTAQRTTDPFLLMN